MAKLTNCSNRFRSDSPCYESSRLLRRLLEIAQGHGRLKVADDRLPLIRRQPGQSRVETGVARPQLGELSSLQKKPAALVQQERPLPEHQLLFLPVLVRRHGHRVTFVRKDLRGDV